MVQGIIDNAVRVALISILGIITSPSSSQALDINEAPLVVLGEGSTTCGEFTANPSIQIAMTQWVLGYISGRNREGRTPDGRTIGYSLRNPSTALSWLQSYCNSHSLDLLVKAAEDLRNDFQKHEAH
jgi:hypothetical protein